MNVVFAIDEKSCRAYLDRHITLPSTSRYFSFEDLSKETLGQLNRKGLQEISPLPYLELDRETVLKAYVDLIGRFNAKMNSRLWWATDLSSKNRFNSRLPEILYRFLLCVQILKKDTQHPFLIIGLPWQAMKTISRVLAGHGVSFEFIGYEPLRKSAGWRSGLKRTFSLNFHVWRLLYRHVYIRMKGIKIPDLPKDKQYYVIKSFVYDHSFTKEGGYKDAFFGPLPDFLKASQDVVFFVNILGDFRRCVKKIKGSKEKIIPLEACSSLFDVLWAYGEACFYSPRLTGDLKFLNHEVGDIIRNELTDSRRIQLYQLLHFSQTKRLLKKLSASVFLTTYENNPWEKMCFMAIRKFSPRTEIIGYQHTVNPPASVNMFISHHEEAVIPKPNVALTTGEIPQEIIVKYTEDVTLPVEPACALRFEQLMNLKQVPRTRHFKILVALEGIFDVYKMVNYVLDQCKGQTEIRLIIRTHPVLPVKAIAHKLKYRLKDLPFVEISRGKTLIEDIERTDMTTYWGSTVSLETLWMGKPVIHYDMETLFSYDPLFNCTYLKWTVNRRETLLKKIYEIYEMPEVAYQAEREKALDYLKRYFYPIGPRNLARFLPAKNA